MKFIPTTLDGVLVVEPEPRRDERGFLARTYCEKEFAADGLNTRWVQQNHTRTLGRGSVRV
jgi:dTDP-4-dehydrorhamnose 3,5-epimerase